MRGARRTGATHGTSPALGQLEEPEQRSVDEDEDRGAALAVPENFTNPKMMSAKSTNVASWMRRSRYPRSNRYHDEAK